MTPLERAQAAIIAEIKRQDVTTLPNGWDEERNCEEKGVLRIDGKIELAPLARAMIEVIREPSEAMVDEGAGYAGRRAENSSHADDNAREAWTAMIDALLAEGGK